MKDHLKLIDEEITDLLLNAKIVGYKKGKYKGVVMYDSYTESRLIELKELKKKLNGY